MKLIKKFLSIAVFAFVLVGSVFSMTACNLINTDKTAYYNQVVATFKYNDQTINVTMTDLNNAFKSYGYSRFNEGNYETMEECINDSLKYHIQKELLFLDIANTLNDVYKDTNNELYNLEFVDFETYDWDKTLANIYKSENPNALEIRHDAFDMMQANVDSFAETILEDEEELGNIEDEDENDPLRPVKKEYDSPIKILDDVDDNGQRTITIEKDIEELKLFTETNIPVNYTVVNNYDDVTTARAYNKYIKVLQQTAKVEGRSTKIEDVISVEESYNIEEAYRNKLLELYQYWYETNLEISTDTVVNYYKNQYDSQLNDFVYSTDAIDKYRTAMDDYNSEYVYYHANSGNEYIIVNHILISFTEEQKHLISVIDKQYEEDKKLFADNAVMLDQLEKQYNDNIINTVMDTKSKVEIDGEETEVYISDIISEVSNYVANNELKNSNLMSEKEINIQKSKNFEDMMYKYNDDPGNMNADFYYAVNVNDGVKTNWEEEFTRGARELYSDYKQGDVLLRPAISSYGIHIMFYSEMATNIVDSDAINSLTVAELVDAKVNTASDKTVFEYLYDKIMLDNYYDNYVSGVINQLYNNAEIKIDSYKFKNLWQ